MRVRNLVTVVFALALPSLVYLPVVLAEGKKTETKKGDGGPPHDPANIAGISQFMETCLEGNGKFLARDFTGAIESYRAAIRLAPKNPLGHYLMGEAHTMNGNLVEAEAAFKNAELNADSRDPQMRAKVLFSLADNKERQKRWEDAKSAWQTYAEWIQKFSDGGTFPMSAQGRIKELDETLKLDQQYKIVRERIAAGTDSGVTESSDAGKK